MTVPVGEPRKHERKADSSMATEQAFVRMEEVAQTLKVSLAHAYRMAKRGEIPSVRFGRTVRVPRDAWTRLLTDKIECAARDCSHGAVIAVGN